MGTLPERLADHWWQRPGRRPGRLQYHWHILFHSEPRVHELAATGQRKLDGLAGLDLVPLQWLHLTTLTLGFAEQVPRQAVDTMVATARHLLAETHSGSQVAAGCQCSAHSLSGSSLATRSRPDGVRM